MPSAKALGKRRAVDLSSDEDDLAPTSVSNKRTRALSPVDPSSLLQQPPESPERPSPRLRLLSSPPPPPEAASAAETDAIRTTLGGHESTDDYVDEDEDDDEVIVVSNSRGPTRHGSQATQPQHLFTMPPGLSSSSSTAFVSTSQQQQQPSSSQYESAPFYRMTCPICMDPPKPMVVTNCGHAFCGECLFSALSAQTNVDTYMATYDPVLRNNILKASKGQLVNGTCPVCRKPIKGGWGTAARGLEWRTEKKKKKKLIDVT